VPDVSPPDAEAAARTRVRAGTGTAVRKPRPNAGRDTRRHQGSRPAEAPGATAVTVRSALPATQLGARAGARRNGAAAHTRADMRVLVSIEHGRKRLARPRNAAAVADVALRLNRLRRAHTSK